MGQATPSYGAVSPPTLEQVKQLLEARGLRPIDYKHLPYEKLLELAGVTRA